MNPDLSKSLQNNKSSKIISSTSNLSHNTTLNSNGTSINRVSILKTEEQKEIVRTNICEPNDSKSGQFTVITESIKRSSSISLDPKQDSFYNNFTNFSFNQSMHVPQINQSFQNKTININITDSNSKIDEIKEQNSDSKIKSNIIQIKKLNEENSQNKYKILIKRIASQLKQKVRTPTQGFFHFALLKGDYPLIIIKKIETQIINHNIDFNNNIFKIYTQKYYKYRELIKRIAHLLKIGRQNSKNINNNNKINQINIGNENENKSIQIKLSKNVNKSDEINNNSNGNITKIQSNDISKKTNFNNNIQNKKGHLNINSKNILQNKSLNKFERATNTNLNINAHNRNRRVSYSYKIIDNFKNNLNINHSSQNKSNLGIASHKSSNYISSFNAINPQQKINTTMKNDIFNKNILPNKSIPNNNKDKDKNKALNTKIEKISVSSTITNKNEKIEDGKISHYDNTSNINNQNIDNLVKNNNEDINKNDINDINMDLESSFVEKDVNMKDNNNALNLNIVTTQSEPILINSETSNDIEMKNNFNKINSDIIPDKKINIYEEKNNYIQNLNTNNNNYVNIDNIIHKNNDNTYNITNLNNDGFDKDINDNKNINNINFNNNKIINSNVNSMNIDKEINNTYGTFNNNNTIKDNSKTSDSKVFNDLNDINDINNNVNISFGSGNNMNISFGAVNNEIKINKSIDNSFYSTGNNNQNSNISLEKENNNIKIDFNKRNSEGSNNKNTFINLNNNPINNINKISNNIENIKKEKRISINSLKNPGKKIEIKLSTFKRDEERPSISKEKSEELNIDNINKITSNVISNEINIDNNEDIESILSHKYDTNTTEEQISFSNKFNLFLSKNNILNQANIPSSIDEKGQNYLKQSIFWEKYIQYIYINFLINNTKISLYTFIQIIEQYFIWCENTNFEEFKKLILDIISKIYNQQEISQFLTMNKINNFDELFNKYEIFMRKVNKINYRDYKYGKEIEIKLDNKDGCNCDLCKNENACRRKMSQINKNLITGVNIESISYDGINVKNKDINNNLSTNNYQITYEGKNKNPKFSKSKTLYSFETVYKYIPKNKVKNEENDEKENEIKETNRKSIKKEKSQNKSMNKNKRKKSIKNKDIKKFLDDSQNNKIDDYLDNKNEKENYEEIKDEEIDQKNNGKKYSIKKDKKRRKNSFKYENESENEEEKKDDSGDADNEEDDYYKKNNRKKKNIKNKRKNKKRNSNEYNDSENESEEDKDLKNKKNKKKTKSKPKNKYKEDNDDDNESNSEDSSSRKKKVQYPKEPRKKKGKYI